MKRRVCVVLLVLVVWCFAGGLCVSAEEATLPFESEKQGWWESLRGSLPDEVSDRLDGIESGEETVGFEYLFTLLANGVRGEWGSFRRVLFTLLGVMVLGGIATLLANDTEGLKKPLGWLLSATTALALWELVSSTVERVMAYVADLTRFSEGLAPVMAGILAVGGATGTAGVTSAALTTLLSLFEVVVGRVLMPLVSVCFAFSLVGAVSDEVRVDGIAFNLKGIYLTVLGVMGIVATGALTLQTVMSSAADSMAMRLTRYTVGNMIPIVGGTIGATLGTLGSSLTVIKSSIGVGAVVACLSLFLPLVLSLYLTRLAFNLAGAFARMMGFRIGEKLLGDFRGIFDMLLAVTALSGTLFLIYIAVFLKTALPLAA